MARRKRRTKKYTVRRKVPYRVSYSRKRSSTGSDFNITKTVFPAILYGGVRAKISQMLTPLTQSIPLGVIADEVALGAGAYFIGKRSKGFVRSFLHDALIIESGRIGENIVLGGLGSLTPNQTQGTGFPV